MALVFAMLIAALWTPRAQSPAARPGLDVYQFLMATPPTPSVHASTIVETPDGVVAAWFGGSREGAPDVGIWVSQLLDDGWTVPREVATGIQADGRRFPCWNPVLHVTYTWQRRNIRHVVLNPSAWR